MNGPQTFHISAWPPSVNEITRPLAIGNTVRKVDTKKGRAWYRDAGQELMLAKPIPVSGPVALGIRLKSPHGRPYDPDNRLKGTIDLLVKQGVIEGDTIKTVKQLWVCEGERDGVEISIWPIGSRPPAWVREAVSWSGEEAA